MPFISSIKATIELTAHDILSLSNGAIWWIISDEGEVKYVLMSTETAIKIQDKLGTSLEEAARVND